MLDFSNHKSSSWKCSEDRCSEKIVDSTSSVLNELTEKYFRKPLFLWLAVAQVEFLELLMIILTSFHCNSSSDFERISSDIKGQRLVQCDPLHNLSLVPKIFWEKIILKDRKMRNSHPSYFLFTL